MSDINPNSACPILDQKVQNQKIYIHKSEAENKRWEEKIWIA